MLLSLRTISAELSVRITSTSLKECEDLLRRVSIGRIACSLNDQPYVVPISFAYEAACLYFFSTAGKKIDCMRRNPRVCVQADEIVSRDHWTSVLVNGTFVELQEPQYTEQKEHARQLLSQTAQWWLTPLAERREHTGDLAIEPLFFRVDVVSMTGLRTVSEP